MSLQHQLPLSHALGWTGPELLCLAKDYPDLALQLLTVPKQRLHFVAFVLAMTATPISADLARQAVNMPVREILGRLGLSELRGVRRVLGRIYGPVLDRDRYQEIAALLAEPNTARVLHHVSEVTPELLANLSVLPIPLRSHVIADAIGHIPNAAAHLFEWTEIVASRLPKFSVGEVQETIGDSCSFVDLKTRLTRLLDALPALEAPPPRVIHHAMRIDAPSAIRQLGKQFTNCLDNFVDAEIDGCSHIYHWRKGQAEAACEVTRVGNLGWFLGSHLGPENTDLNADVAATIRAEFRMVGIHELKVVETYDDLFYAVGRRNGTGVNDNGQFTARNRRRHLPYLREFELRTLKGELVKSFEECEIANWLYLSGIEYEYERPYEHDTTTPQRRQYQPDFHLPRLGIYIEHFGVDASGRPPPFIDEQAYCAGMEWKRGIHREYGTKLIETYSYEKKNGTLLTDLHAKIEAAFRGSLITTPVSIAEALSRLEGDSRIDGFSRLTATFLRHLKGGQHTIATLRARLPFTIDNQRALAYLDIFEPLFNAYQAQLKATETIDFQDMIAKATHYVETKRFQSPYRYILVDEFQDISVGRANLINALLCQKHDGQLFAVGDDWQSIFRFAGSDISLMTGFAKHFGTTAQTLLEDTFRCNDRIANLASGFVLRNPAQIRKTVKAARLAAGPAVFVFREDPESAADPLRKALEHIAKSIQGKAGVMLIGRYRHDEPKNLVTLRAAFPSLRLSYRTAHGSKGLEDDNVVILGLRSGRLGFPNQIVDDPLLDLVLAVPEAFPHSEERRLLYVAMTRARNAVYLLTPQSAPSSFLAEIDADLGFEQVGDTNSESARCPICKGGHLRLRQASDRTFVGCSNYPYCDHTERSCPKCRQGILRRMGPSRHCSEPSCGHEVESCPRCETGWLVERRRKDGSGTFLGCSSYPECRHTANMPGPDRDGRPRRSARLD